MVKPEGYGRSVILSPDGDRTCFALPNGAAIPIHPIFQQVPFEAQAEYAQAYTDAWAEAFKRQGPAAFEHSKLSAAIHEAGHLVLGALDGFSFAWSRIWRQGRHWVGFTEAHGEGMPVGPGAPPDGNLKEARHVMAGYMAEHVFEGDDARDGSSLDERVAAFFLVTFAGVGLSLESAAISDLVRETEQSVAKELRSHEESARAIARALVSAHPLKLQGAKLEAVLARVTH